MVRAVHYVGFKDDRFLIARRTFGGPVFIHRWWDLRAQRDVGDDDLVVFADGPADQVPRSRNGSDLDEPDDPARWER
jgi:hypothetical protein